MEVITYDVVARERYFPDATEKKPNTLNVVIPLVMSFIAGTGGAMTAQSAEAMGRWVHTPAIHVTRPAQEPVAFNKSDIRTPSEHLTRIRDVFALNMSELANVLGVSRPTAYAWLEGQEPGKQEAIVEIRHLAELAETLDALSINRINKLIRRPIFGVQSFLDKLKARENIDDAIATFKRAINQRKAKPDAK